MQNSAEFTHGEYGGGYGSAPPYGYTVPPTVPYGSSYRLHSTPSSRNPAPANSSYSYYEQPPQQHYDNTSQPAASYQNHIPGGASGSGPPANAQPGYQPALQPISFHFYQCPPFGDYGGGPGPYQGRGRGGRPSQYSGRRGGPPRHGDRPPYGGPPRYGPRGPRPMRGHRGGPGDRR